VRTFIVIWLGQFVSTIGSYMTEFALSLWVWELTQSATAMALMGFFSQLPRIPMTLIAGVIVDRFSRKRLMLLGDTVAALSTLVVLLLYGSGQLQIWHLYGLAMLNGGFSQIQQLAYSASVSLLVPPAQYTRANSLNSGIHYGSIIFAPALAGLLYPVIGLVGIGLVDLVSFGVAIATLLPRTIPQPAPAETAPPRLRQQLSLGLRYIWKRPYLRAVLLVSGLFWFFHDLGGAIYDPMILARSGGDARVFGSVASAAGLGGVTGACLLSWWGGPKRATTGMLAGYVGAGLCKTVFGLGQSVGVWLPAQFGSSLNFPLLSSSEQTIWMKNTAPEIQGRVFAANALVLQGVSAIALLIAGPLAERVFESALASPPETLLPLASLWRQGEGAGLSLLYVLTALAMLLIGLGGYKVMGSLRSTQTPKPL
jgi:MFS transporter, DHA3 family, macrolide efflux protein